VTNFSNDFLRNRIRNELLPLLRKNYQPAVDRTVLRLMDIVGAESGFVSETACCWERRHPAGPARRKTRSHAGRMPALPDDGFDNLPLAVQRKVLQQQLVSLGWLPDFELVEQLRETPDRPVSIAAGVSVVRDAAGIISCRQAETAGFNLAELKLKLAGRVGRTEFGGQKFSWAVEKCSGSRGPDFVRLRPDQRSSHRAEFFDVDKLPAKLFYATGARAIDSSLSA